MNKLLKPFIVFALVAIVLTSCKKDDNPILPDPENGKHAQLWSYDFGVGSLSDIFPAIDENDNTYFAMTETGGNSMIVVASNNNGSELWKKTITGSSSSRVIYADNKIFVAGSSPSAIYCLNASSGNTEWEHDFSSEYDFFGTPSMAYANNRLYLSTYELIASYLQAFDISGNEIWQREVESAGLNISVSGNSLFFKSGNTIQRYDDNGNSCDSVWTLKVGNKTNRSLLAMTDLPIGADGNIYFREDNDIFVVSQSGQLINSILLDASFDNSPSNITLTSNNDILIGKGNLVKFDKNGNVEWETDIKDGIIINPSFNVAPVIAENGNYYDAQLFGLYSVKSNGSLNWKVNAENGGGEEYGNLHPPVLNHDGNIISVSAEQKVIRCFKGDGSKLASSGWPKPFADYGNTSSH